MSVVIYNPASHDAILTAAFLQTIGWRAFSSREVVDVKDTKFLWLGVYPTPKNMENQSDENSHEVYLSRYRTPYSSSAIRGSVHRSSEMFDSEDHNYASFSQEYGIESLQKTYMAQVAAIHGIRAPELHALIFMAREFNSPNLTLELKANLTLNISEALNCLKSGQMFAPILLPSRDKIDKDLERALDVHSDLSKISDRILGHATHYVRRLTKVGGVEELRRFVTTYESENAWFLRSRLESKDLWTNIDTSSTGTLLTTNDIIELDYPVVKPVYVQI